MKEKNALHRLRERRGLTQEEVAEELGVSRQSVSQWESGKTFPSVKKQIVLSRLYGVPMEQLYPEGAAQEMEEPEAPPAVGDTLDEAAAEIEETPPAQTRKHRKIAPFIIIIICIWCGTFLWGKLTNSRAVATIYLIWETAAFFAVGILKFFWRNKK